MIRILLLPTLVAIALYGFFQPLSGALAYLAFIGLFEGWMLLAMVTNKPGFSRSETWTAKELQIIKMYYLYFRFPNASSEFSGLLSGIQLLTFIWVPWLLYHRVWVPAVLIGLNYFAAVAFAVKLNPRFFLHDAVERRGQNEYGQDMEAVDSILEKINKKIHDES